jgi:ChpA-C
MSRIAKAVVLTVAAGAAFAGSTGAAFADSTATGTASDSPGVISGNSLQTPVHVPANVCGSTVNVIGLLDPATGSACTN